MKSINLAIRFAFELCAIVALAYWGTKTGSGAGRWLLALAAAGPMWLGVLFGAAAFANIALVYAMEGEAGGGATVSR